MSKKSKRKIWIYSVILGVIFVGGTFFTLSKMSVFPETLNVFSNCRFNPEITPQNKALIDETITTVGDNGVLSLAGREKHLKDMGAILSKEVPDLTYWAYVLSNPKLVQEMKKIQDSSLKYNGFIEGTRDKLMQEYKENPCLLEQAKKFAKYLKIPEEETVAVLKECIDNNDKDKHEFKKFLDYIINEKAK